MPLGKQKRHSTECLFLLTHSLQILHRQGEELSVCGAYMSEAPAWRGRVQCHTQWHRSKAPKSQFLRQEIKIEKQGFVLAFRKTRVRLYVYVLLNASVLLALRPLRTSNSNDKRLISLCFVVIAKNNSLDCFCSLLFKLSSSVICLQGFVGTKCRNSGTRMLAYVSEAPAWRGRVQCHSSMAQVQSTKIPAKRQKKGHRE